MNVTPDYFRKATKSDNGKEVSFTLSVSVRIGTAYSYVEAANLNAGRSFR